MTINNHKKLIEELHETYKAKNADYGNSFSETFFKYGKITALTRIADKFNRLESLILNDTQQVDDESLEDTLKDLANYCLMSVLELQKGEPNDFREEDIRKLLWNVEQWFIERETDSAKFTKKGQLEKLEEEVNELIHAEDKDEEMDAIGDILVVLIGYCRLVDLELMRCLAVAYHEIKDRKGKMIDGTFVKDK